MNYPKYFGIFLWLLFSSGFVMGQPYYVTLHDAVGLNQGGLGDELEDAAQLLAEAMPQGFQYDIGFYLHTEVFEGGYPAAFQKAIDLASSLSDYYLLFGRQFDYTGTATKIWVDFKLPDEGQFACFSDETKTIIDVKIRGAINEMIQNANNQGEVLFNSQLVGIAVAEQLISKTVSCCTQRNQRSVETCNLYYSFEDIVNIVEALGYSVLCRECGETYQDNNLPLVLTLADLEKNKIYKCITADIAIDGGISLKNIESVPINLVASDFSLQVKKVDGEIFICYRIELDGQQITDCFEGEEEYSENIFCSNPTSQVILDAWVRDLSKLRLRILSESILKNIPAKKITQANLDQYVDNFRNFLIDNQYNVSFYLNDIKNNQFRFVSANQDRYLSATEMAEAASNFKQGIVEPQSDYAIWAEYDDKGQLRVDFKFREGFINVPSEYNAVYSQKSFDDQIIGIVKKKIHTFNLGNYDEPILEDVEEAASFEDDGKLVVNDASVFRFIAATMSELGYVANHAEIRTSVWDTGEDDYPFKVINIYAPVAGAGDGALLEYRDMREMIELCGQLLTEPQQTISQLYSGFSELLQAGVITMVEQSLRQTIQDLSTPGPKRQHDLAKGTVGAVISIVAAYKLYKKFYTAIDEAGSFQKLFTNFVNNFSQQVKDNIANLPQELKKKFFDDFNDGVDDVKDFFNGTPEGVKAWEKLSGLTGTREWTRTSIPLLEKMSGKSDDFMDKVRQYYSTHQKPAGTGAPPFTHQGTSFDNFGHPDLFLKYQLLQVMVKLNINQVEVSQYLLEVVLILQMPIIGQRDY